MKMYQSLRTAAVIVIALAVAMSVMGAIPVIADEPPPPPHSFYGEVSIEGEPAPAGTEIVAVIDDEARGDIVTEEDGYYGGPTVGEEKLIVQGDHGEEGEEVTFFVDGEIADQTVEWQSGSDDELDLTVGESDDPPPGNGDDDAPPPPPPGDGNDDANGDDDNGDDDANDDDDNGDDDANGDDDNGDAGENGDDDANGDDDNGDAGENGDDDANGDAGENGDDVNGDDDGDDVNGDDDGDDITETGGDDDDGIPGFGIVLAMIALLSVGLARYRT